MFKVNIKVNYLFLAIFLSVISAVIIISDVASSQNTPIISIKTNNYIIQGSTVKELREQMNKLGPLDRRSGKRFDAYASWNVSTNYRYKPVGNQCKIYTVTVKTDVIFTMPKWNIPANSSSDLRMRWNRYINNLQTHENGHRNHGINAGKEIFKMLNSVTAPYCNQINGIANQKTQEIIKKYNQLDIDYDKRTKHGRTQGAVFP